MVFASSYDVKVFWRELFVTNDKLIDKYSSLTDQTHAFTKILTF